MGKKDRDPVGESDGLSNAVASETPPGASTAGEKPATSAPAGAGPVKRTPREWAERLGLVTKPDAQLLAALGPNAIQTQGATNWKHAAANQLWGWGRHAYNYQAERFEITEEQYRNALDAAASFPCCELPDGAIPPSELERFKNFVPRRSRKPRKERN